MSTQLQSLARICTKSGADAADVVGACTVVAAALGARDAYVIRAGDPAFIRIGCPCDPAAYEIKQKGYWLVWQQLATNSTLVAGLFDSAERIASGGMPIGVGKAATHLGAILPGNESNSDVLIVHGPWPDGLSEEQIAFVETARPILGHLVGNVLDADRRVRQRTQLESLANVSNAFNQARESDNVLSSIATAIAKAAGFEWVVLETYDETGEAILERVLNTARYSETSTAASWRDGKVVQPSTGQLQLGAALAKSGDVFLMPDVTDETAWERRQRLNPVDPAPLKKFYERAHIVSVAVFPIVFQQRALGSVSFAASTPHAFDQAEVEFLTALVVQAATALKGVRLYDELERSRDELRASEERFRSLVQNSSDLITILDVDGTLRYASPSVERLMGYRPEEWLGMNILTLIHPDDLSRAANSLAAVIDQPGAHPPLTLRVRHNDGSWRYIEMTANNLIAVPSIGGVVFNARDVTERWLAENLVRESEERFRSLVQNASDLITVIEPDGTIIYQSPSIERVLGHAAPNVVGRKLTDLTHPDDVHRIASFITDAMKLHGATNSVAVRLGALDGSWVRVEIVGTDHRDDAAVRGLVLNIRDVSERHALEEQLRFEAFHDPLTQLANRAQFADRLAHALDRRVRRATQLAVLFLDLDNFKSVNDSLGHAAGDALLTEVGRRLQTCTRPEDTVARLGGDEFAVLLEDVASIDEVFEATRRILSVLRTPVSIEGRQLVVPASIGIAVGAGETDAGALLRNADVAMYAAKALGKNRYEAYEPSMHAAALDRLDLAGDLEGAVERGEYILEYQPILILASGEVAGVEALVRWNHPTRGQIQPDGFISLTEETGAIIELGRWVLGEACRQACAWYDEFKQEPQFAMNVNVSARQLLYPGFVDDVARALEECRIEPGSLVLEITESVMMRDTQASLAILRQLKDLGVRLAIDDFGTGYSSLGYLRQFPFDIPKIDRSYIATGGELSSDQDLERAIVDMGRTLKLEIVAEGVEQAEQLDRLKSLHCELGEGFYFARPMAPDKIRDVLRERRDRQHAA